MKLNPDCMRDIMLLVEDLPLNGKLTPTELYDSLPKYTQDELTYTCIKLEEANLMDAYITKADNAKILVRIFDLTVSGHEFVKNIHNDDVWSKVKSKASKVGSFSIKTLITIASKVISDLIDSSF
ncbi:DUF2513 domain-containing protein [Anaerovoracaceae bacterium SGI.195]